MHAVVARYPIRRGLEPEYARVDHVIFGSTWSGASLEGLTVCGLMFPDHAGTVDAGANGGGGATAAQPGDGSGMQSASKKAKVDHIICESNTGRNNVRDKENIPPAGTTAPKQQGELASPHGSCICFGIGFARAAKWPHADMEQPFIVVAIAVAPTGNPRFPFLGT